MEQKRRPNENEIRRQVVDFDLKSTTDADGYAGTFSGYAAGILNIDSAGDMILPGAFNDDIPRFLNEGAVCWNHDWMTPIGKPLSAKEDDHGLFVEAQISKTTAGSDIMTLIRDGVIKKMSIGYRVKEYEWVDRSGLVAYLGANAPSSKAASILKQYDEAELTELFLIKKLKLYEFSPVTFPANNNAIITQAKNNPLAGLPFADHSKTVLATVSEYAERAKAIIELRAKDNRTLSSERLSDLEEIADGLRLSLSQIESVASAAPVVNNGAALLLFAQYQKLEARLNGCAV